MLAWRVSRYCLKKSEPVDVLRKVVSTCYVPPSRICSILENNGRYPYAEQSFLLSAEEGSHSPEQLSNICRSFPYVSLALSETDIGNLHSESTKPPIASRGRSTCLNFNFADSLWRLPIRVSDNANHVRKTAAEAAELFRLMEEKIQGWIFSHPSLTMSTITMFVLMMMMMMQGLEWSVCWEI